ncbi:DNA-binding SARP family transcriptional activator [Nocardioides thalensis]|uniref:DNA-binding SARP family transcriptional activator n=1 Tax=Nocardioides thalensis TaxID=1914755 RepID=A0A853C5N4_9ACTN|nr:AfsR/SARP family transcriptional regulator [Nocardioides thalensis]NYJ02471.1 DNA-binding SARP family transcriptional activator [Nocardioides thalensis]
MTDAPLVRLLGAVAVRQPDGTAASPARLDRTVLAHLALAAGRAVPAADLIDAVWGAHPPDGARNALQVKVSRLRRHLGPHGDALRHHQGSYRLDLPAAEVDLLLADELARLARASFAADRVGEAAVLAERGLALWQGPPFADLDDHPRLVAARDRADEDHAVLQEVVAAAAIDDGATVGRAVEVLRELLAGDPLRSSARLLLMRALDRAGRRAEALAVYDVGRRVLAEETGLAPPEPLQREFERLLAAERRAARREPGAVATRTVPAGAMATARWLAREGAADAAIELALRGSWWWWLGGRRSEGRDLLEELVGLAAADGGEHASVRGATAWVAVFDSVSAAAEEAIAAGEATLKVAAGQAWSRHESLAAVLLAERLFQRGEPRRGAVLLELGRAGFDRSGDAWGRALVRIAEAKADLQRGAVLRAAARGREALAAFEDLDDAAGRMMATDLLGYCAEVVGDLSAAARTHQRALALARDVDAPEWQATQLTRLGSVQALIGSERSLTTLQAGVELARSVGSSAGVALAENGLGLARGLSGQHERAAEIHADALAWYERQASPAGISYTAGRLALELAAIGSEEAATFARRSVDLARRTGDPRAVAHGLEAVALTPGDAPARARALGGARALRRRTGSPLPEPVAAALRAAAAELSGELGDDLAVRMREGVREAQGLLPGVATA